MVNLLFFFLKYSFIPVRIWRLGVVRHGLHLEGAALICDSSCTPDIGILGVPFSRVQEGPTLQTLRQVFDQSVGDR